MNGISSTHQENTDGNTEAVDDQNGLVAVFIRNSSPNRRHEQSGYKSDAENKASPPLNILIRKIAERLDIEGEERHDHGSAAGHKEVGEYDDEEILFLFIHPDSLLSAIRESVSII
jgi:hypothetical protein